MKAASVESGELAPTRGFISRNSLYRIARAAVISLAGLCLGFSSATTLFGQEGKPEIIPQKTRPESNGKTKKGKEPRAVAILQFGTGSKATLIPLAILIDGRFYDAGAYKADPIPMALETGTVYEAETAGDPQGLFTVNGALHNNHPGSEHPWMGTGSFVVHGAEAPKSSHKAEDVPLGLNDTGDEPPKLTRKGSTEKSGASPADGKGTSPAPVSSAPPEKPTEKDTDKPAAASGPDKSKEADPAGKGSEQVPAGDKPSDPPAKDANGKDQNAKEHGDENYYRPTLRRGKPTETAPVEKDDAATAKAVAQGESPAAAPVMAAGMRVEAAISDAAGPGPQSYKFFWKTGEEDERRAQMTTLAEKEVATYLATLAKNHISSVAPKAVAGKSKSALKPAKPILENIQFRGFNPWLTDQPVMILSADARVPGWAGAGSGDVTYSVLLVGRTDIYGDLKKVHVGVTDKFHLDVIPRLDFIDVVDADGDGRGEFIFRETSDAGSGYIIYRPTADKLYKLFDSLHAE